MTAGAGGAGAVGVRPGMPTNCVLHSGMPVGSPVSSMLLSHCEKEFQNFRIFEVEILIDENFECPFQ